jgi:hypothetical protein
MNLLLSMFVSLSEPATSTWLDISEWFLLICGLLLLIGIFGEYDKLPKRLFPFSEATFAMLVMLAIAGELVGDGGVFIFSSHLQKLEGADIQTLSQKSEAALRDASTADDDAKSAAAVSNDAKSKSDEAEKSAGSAQILAQPQSRT